MIAKYAKAIAATLGGLAPATVVGYLAMVGINLDVTVVAGVLAVLSPLASLVATIFGPANAAPETASTGKHALGNMADESTFVEASEEERLAALHARVSGR